MFVPSVMLPKLRSNAGNLKREVLRDPDDIVAVERAH